jgi:cold shock CspA family protein
MTGRMIKMEKESGFISTWLAARNYGWIQRCKDGIVTSVFVHASQVSRIPKSGDRCLFEVKTGEKGLYAANCEVLGAGLESVAAKAVN